MRYTGGSDTNAAAIIDCTFDDGLSIAPTARLSDRIATQRASRSLSCSPLSHFFVSANIYTRLATYVSPRPFFLSHRLTARSRAFLFSSSHLYHLPLPSFLWLSLYRHSYIGLVVFHTYSPCAGLSLAPSARSAFRGWSPPAHSPGEPSIDSRSCLSVSKTSYSLHIAQLDTLLSAK